MRTLKAWFTRSDARERIRVANEEAQQTIEGLATHRWRGRRILSVLDHIGAIDSESAKSHFRREAESIVASANEELAKRENSMNLLLLAAGLVAAAEGVVLFGFLSVHSISGAVLTAVALTISIDAVGVSPLETLFPLPLPDWKGHPHGRYIRDLGAAIGRTRALRRQLVKTRRALTLSSRLFMVAMASTAVEKAIQYALPHLQTLSQYLH